MKNLLFTLALSIFLNGISPVFGQVTQVAYRNLNTACTVSSSELQTMQNEIREAESGISPEKQINLAENLFTKKTGCFTSAQIKSLVKSIVSPENQLAVAKLGYDHVSDPENYSVVSGAFSFPSEIEAFNDFLRAKN